MLDPQLVIILKEITKLQLFTIGMIAITSIVGMAALCILGLSLRRITESTERIAQMTTQILRDIRAH